MKADEKYVSHVESDIRWSSHDDLHDSAERGVDKDLISIKDSINANLSAHERVHDIHADAHQREHEMTNLAIKKAEESMDRRLDSMNEFREQLNIQSTSFVTRETYDKYVSDTESKIELALATLSDKEDALIRSLVNRHDSDFNSLRELIQVEREIRKSSEGSINTWKWIVGFLGASGLGGVILLFITGAH